MDNRTIGTATIALFSLLTHFTVAQQPSVEGNLGTAEHRRYSWHPDGLVAVLGDERGRKWDLAGQGLDVRSDGKQLAAGGWSGAIYLWNAETMELERLLQGHEGGVHAVQYSADGSLLTSVGADKTIRVWGLAADEPAQTNLAATLDNPPRYATSSADRGTLVFGGQGDEATRVWRSGSLGVWRETMSIRVPKPTVGETPDDIRQLAKALDAKGLVSMSTATYAVSADGALFASSLGGSIISIETEDGGVSTTQSSDVVVWRIGGSEPEKLWTIEGVGFVRAMAFSPDGSLLAIGTQDNTVRTFSIDRDPPQIRHEFAMPESIEGLCFARRSETLAVAAGTVRLWHLFADAATPGLEAPCTKRGLGSIEMTFSPDGRTLYYVDGAVVRRWEVERPYEDPSAGAGVDFTAAHAVSFTPDGTQLLAAVGRNGDGRLLSWDVNLLSVGPHEVVEIADRRVDDLAVSEDGQRFVFSAYKHPRYTLELWERTDDGLARLDVADLEAGHPGSFWCAAFSPDAMTLASGHRDGAIRMWDTSTNRLKLLRTLANVHPLGVGGIDYSPDGNALAAVDWGGGVHIWQAAGDGLRKVPLVGKHSDRAYAVRFSPDGRLLVTGDYGGEILLWDIQAERPQASKLTAHTGNISALDFASDGRRLLSAGQDGRIIIWDVLEKRILAEWRFPGNVNDAKFDPSGRYIVTANGNGAIYVWRP